MAKFTVSFAMSLDNYIATKDGGYDFIEGDGGITTRSEWNFETFMKQVDIIIMGKNSYKEEFHKHFPEKEVVVITRHPEDDTSVTFITDLEEWTKEVKVTDKHVFVFGGSPVIDSLREQIDEWIVGIVPVLLGGGRRLFLEELDLLKLQLTNTWIDNGIVMLQYEKRE